MSLIIPFTSSAVVRLTSGVLCSRTIRGAVHSRCKTNQGPKAASGSPSRSSGLTPDPTRITQVFDNLLQNAVKFTPPGGRVLVNLAVLDTERQVGISVSDTGIGMEPATLTTLFEPFAQADQSLDRSSGGLGLGLALSRQLLELHGARIEAHSAGIGRGSEFRVQSILPTAGCRAKGHRQ